MGDLAERLVKITIPYRPRNWAKPFHASFCRWAAIVLHRRAGKTTATLNHHQRAALDDDWESQRLRTLEPKFTAAEVRELLQYRQYGHILPMLGQAKSVAWEPLKRIAAVVPGATPNESELSIKYPRQPKAPNRISVPVTGKLNPDTQTTTVRLFGADNPDAFRGLPFSGVSYDEYSQHPPNIHGEVVSKALADHLGYGVFEGTIKGKNQLYRTYEAAKDDPAWFSLWQDVDQTLKTEDGATITAIRRAMQDDLAQIASGLMLQSEYDQEWFLSPSAAIKGAYYGKLLESAIKEKRVGVVPYDPALKVYDVWDLGKGTKMAVGMFQRYGRSLQMIDYLQGNESDGIPQLINQLQQKPYVWGAHFAPHDIRSTDLGTGKTRLATADGLGWRFDVVPSVSVDDGISAARLVFPRLWVDEEKCRLFLDAIGQYRQEWDEKRGMFRDTPLHDWCVTADTKVLTRHGTHQIQYLPPEGEVLTPCGWKPYQHPRMTRRHAPLVEVVFNDGLTVRCTPEHLFLTASGWKSAANLLPGLVIQSSWTSWSNISTGISIAFGPRIGISLAGVRAFIGRCGDALSAQYRRAVISTIETVTPPIINWAIWSVSRPVSTPWSHDQRETAHTLQRLRERLRPSGISQRPADSGTAGWRNAPSRGPNGHEWIAPARPAGRWYQCWFGSLATLRSFVLRRVNPLRIAAVNALPYRADVWCLTVPDGHSWSLENGGVTHNSSHPADMFRYAALVEDQMTNEEAPSFSMGSPLPADLHWSAN